MIVRAHNTQDVAFAGRIQPEREQRALAAPRSTVSATPGWAGR
jgi:hypothetical protein